MDVRQGTEREIRIKSFSYLSTVFVSVLTEVAGEIFWALYWDLSFNVDNDERIDKRGNISVFVGCHSFEAFQLLRPLMFAIYFNKQNVL
jgi:hypothetical protein